MVSTAYNLVYLLTYVIATPPDRGWQRNDDDDDDELCVRSLVGLTKAVL